MTYCVVLGCRYFESLKAETRKGAFDEQETESLRKLVEKHGVGTSLSHTLTQYLNID